MSLEVRSLCKSFGSKYVVQDLSFTVDEGKVFGLLGLNGAGKSTTIRMILNILEPDRGDVLWQGQPARKVIQGHVGYLPEERGLYQKMTVMDHLVLFARLQGMTRSEAIAASAIWLDRFGVAHYRDKQISELSKGNQQKVQFIAAIIHNPQLLILDEPFSGLDPVNVSLFKEVFREMVKAGSTIIFSSHQLEHVEELSDTIGIVHDAHMVLYGDVEQILHEQPPREIRLRANPDDVRPHLDEGVAVETERGVLSIPIDACDPHTLLQRLVTAGVDISYFELVRPSLADIFLQKVGGAA
ncbi:ABC transporter ATP-binding protein [Alicyclobacillus shizuokensis]|uniref:ABC transporter ATP-binding protein n=1 Tax=Alicyclobacillus shizuokensis TaxID=392014 RepID=UPI00082B8F24|nr:ATP-binding cassette domain-containing protein [Alicyclobacillus shizuokensis]MCL6627493.1 ATP-binding cassette domain-containing protein [Alicyclobacillus shizuokensis]